MAKSASKIIMAGVLGLAVGVAVGMMFAPAKGTRTRKRIKKSIRVLTDEMEGDLSEKLESIKAIFTKGAEEREEENK
jgi:gas vesicle protein